MIKLNISMGVVDFMGFILLNTLGFILTISLGYTLKQKGIFKQEDGKVLSKLFLYVTLPATIIVGVNGTIINARTFSFISLGILFNLILALIGFGMGKKASHTEKVLLMITTASFNIGGFTIPFVYGLMPHAVAYVSMFDIGNALMLTGGTLVLSTILIKTKEKQQSTLSALKALIKNPIFVTYIIMFSLSLLSIEIPDFLLSPLRLLSNANSFIAMFTIGLFMRLSLNKSGWKFVRTLLITRYASSIALALFIFFLFPVELFLRQILVLIVLSPIANLPLIQATELGGDEGVFGICGSVSILTSLILMTAAMLLM